MRDLEEHESIWANFFLTLSLDKGFLDGGRGEKKVSKSSTDITGSPRRGVGPTLSWQTLSEKLWTGTWIHEHPAFSTVKAWTLIQFNQSSSACSMCQRSLPSPKVHILDVRVILVQRVLGPCFQKHGCRFLSRPWPCFPSLSVHQNYLGALLNTQISRTYYWIWSGLAIWMLTNSPRDYYAISQASTGGLDLTSED